MRPMDCKSDLHSYERLTGNGIGHCTRVPHSLHDACLPLKLAFDYEYSKVYDFFSSSSIHWNLKGAPG